MQAPCSQFGGVASQGGRAADAVEALAERVLMAELRAGDVSLSAAVDGDLAPTRVVVVQHSTRIDT